MSGFQRLSPEVSPRLDPMELDFMLAHVILNPGLFSVARGLIHADLFSGDSESVQKLAWETAVTLADRHNDPKILSENRAVAWNMMEATANAIITANPSDYTEAVRASISSRDPNDPGIFFWMYSILRPEELKPEWGNDLLVRFLRERTVTDALSKVVNSAHGAVIDNLTPIVHEIAAQEAYIAQLSSDPVESGAPEGWEPQPIGKYPTGVDFIDMFLQGGHAPGETYGVLGAYGSGKTTLAVQIFAESGLYQQQLAAVRPGYTPGDVYLFHYERSGADMRKILWGFVAQIHQTITMQEYRKENLSTRGNLKDYEKERWARDLREHGPMAVRGERERIEDAIPRIRKNMWMIDMSGAPDNPKRGTGYVPEMGLIIQNHQNKLDQMEREKAIREGRDPSTAPRHHVSVVVVDYAGLCAKRHLRANNLPDSRLRHLIGDFGDLCRIHIADRFRTPVWIMHQLSGEANKRTHGTKQVHADAAESKAFAENLWFCFSMGTKDAEFNTMYFNCSKARRAGLGKPPLIQVDGNFSKIVLARNLTTDARGRVVPVGSLGINRGALIAVRPNGDGHKPVDQTPLL